MTFATILVLLYGKYHNLHRRCLESIRNTVPPETPIRVGLNEVCDKTLEWLERGGLAEQTFLPGTLKKGCASAGIVQERSMPHLGRVTFFSSGNENIKKYPMMRRMLYEAPAIQTPWIVWFDDDTFVDDNSPWWDAVERTSKNAKDVYLGETWFIHYKKAQWNFITGRPWYCNKPPEVINGRPGIHFHTGGFVAAKHATLKRLNWPDETLLHNGGDFLLSEALRQQGESRTAIPTKKLGIHVNASTRRGYSEKPTGA